MPNQYVERKGAKIQEGSNYNYLGDWNAITQGIIKAGNGSFWT